MALKNSIQLTKNVNFLCFYNTGCRIVQHCTTIQHILLTKFTVSCWIRGASLWPAIHTCTICIVLVSSTNVINDTQHFHKVLVSHYFTCIFWSTAPKLAFANYHHSFFYHLGFCLISNVRFAPLWCVYNGLHELVIVSLSLSLLSLSLTALILLLLGLLLLLLALYNADDMLTVFVLIVYYPRSSSRAANRVRNELMIKFHQPAANPSGRYNEFSLPILSSSNFFLAIFEYNMSIGCDWSYKLGACNIISAVPTTQAIAKIQRNKRSNTMATYFQSSSTW